MTDYEDLTGIDEEFEPPEPSSTVPQKKSKRKPRTGILVHRFLCSVSGCTYTTPYKKDLVRHMRKHTGEKPYTCELCSKQFSRYDKLMSHTRGHEGLKSFCCTFPSCNYTCVDSSALKRHVARVHSDEKPYQCQLCPYRAKDSEKMNIHLRFHTGDSPYTCATCSKGFKTSTDLQRHVRTHTKEKPFWCSYCPFTTAIKCNLTVHIKRRHSQCPPKGTLLALKRKRAPKPAVQEGNIELPFSLACKLCSFKTETIKSIKLHMVKRHQTTKYESVLDEFVQPKPKVPRSKLLVPVESTKYRCTADPLCVATFVSDKSLRCHMRQHVSLHPPPAPTVEVVIPAIGSEPTTTLVIAEHQSEFDFKTPPPLCDDPLVIEIDHTEEIVSDFMLS